MSTRPFLMFLAGIAVAFAIPALGQSVSSRFSDVPSGSYYSDAVNQLSGLGIIQGYNNGRFGPNDFITRAQVAVLFQRYDQSVVQPMRDQLNVINAKLGLNQCNGHVVGDSYKSPDGCNTCSCTSNGEVCTLRACMSSASSSSSRSSAGPVCGNGICEQGEASYCPSQDCAPGEVCPQYCIAGSCMRDCTSSSSASSLPSWCKPYVCADGTTAPSCTIDGHVINYFADPCMTHGGQVQ